jgi:ABC-type molybdate transport system substrate-binding protein
MYMTTNTNDQKPIIKVIPRSKKFRPLTNQLDVNSTYIIVYSDVNTETQIVVKNGFFGVIKNDYSIIHPIIYKSIILDLKSDSTLGFYYVAFRESEEIEHLFVKYGQKLQPITMRY